MFPSKCFYQWPINIIDRARARERERRIENSKVLFIMIIVVPKAWRHRWYSIYTYTHISLRDFTRFRRAAIAPDIYEGARFRSVTSIRYSGGFPLLLSGPADIDGARQRRPRKNVNSWLREKERERDREEDLDLVARTNNTTPWTAACVKADHN